MNDLDAVRPSVKTFAYLMEKELTRNDWKGGWEKDSAESLFIRLVEEVGELARDLDRGKNSVGECADIANFAMMISEKLLKRKVEKEYA